MRGLTSADAQALARLHAQAFKSAWEAPALADLLSQSGVLGLARDEAGFILCRVVADEAEILTLATVPEARRQGLGQALVEAVCEAVSAQGAVRLFLEVAEDNAAARALYAATGFVEAGRRRGYYARPVGPPIDALVLSRTLSRTLARIQTPTLDEDFIRHLPSR